MEMVAWLAGEEHSDGPRCTSPVIAAFVRAFNDLLPTDEARSHYLRPLLPRLVRTVGTDAIEHRRALAIADCTARVLAPLVLERHGMRAEAESLRQLPAIANRLAAQDAAWAMLEFGSATKAATWLLSRAADGKTPAIAWAATAARVASEAGSPAAFDEAAALIERLVEVGAAPQVEPAESLDALFRHG